jgi:hypothetical protein
MSSFAALRIFSRVKVIGAASGSAGRTVAPKKILHGAQDDRVLWGASVASTNAVCTIRARWMHTGRPAGAPTSTDPAWRVIHKKSGLATALAEGVIKDEDYCS